MRQQQLWQELDADLLSAVLARPQVWGDGFDVGRVQAMWRRARAGEPGPRDELLLQRVIWRAAFADHLAAVNGEPVQVVAPPTSALPPARRSRSAGAVRVLATYANDVPLARRLARTSVGRRVRRRLGA